MSSSKESLECSTDTVESGESTDRSLSDSWTVLDSSHLKDDGDLSDAESVEVLAGDDLPAEEVFFKGKVDDATTGGESGNSLPCETENSIAAAAAAAQGDKSGDADKNQDEEVLVPGADDPVSTAPHLDSSIKDGSPDSKGCWLREVFVGLALELSIFSLVLDLVFLGLLGFSMTGGDQSFFPASSKNSKLHEQFEVDPLSLQLSHVLAEWKKHPYEDHSLDRHLLKTLLLFYGESTELSANLHHLTERVQKYNDIIKHGKEQNSNKIEFNRMVVSGHLAHSVACILGKYDNDKPIPADLFMTANHSEESNDFAPEPGFWLNDWHLPQYFKANNTYNRIDSKPIPPPMQNLYLNLGSAKWNQYFWELYHRNGENDVLERSPESDLDGEDTERSPLDLNSAGDFVSDEESSGSALTATDNPEERVGVLYPLFLNNLNAEGEVLHKTFKQHAENVLEEHNEEDEYGIYVSNDEEDKCWNEDCQKSDEMLVEYAGKLEIVDKEEIYEEIHPAKVPKKKKTKVKDGKRKSKSHKRELENLRNKNKQNKRDKRDKQKFSSEDTGFGSAKKIKIKDGKKTSKLEGSGGMSNHNHFLKNEDEIIPRDPSSSFQPHEKKIFDGSSNAINRNHYLKYEDKIISRDQSDPLHTEENIYDWNSRMAQGREKLRALTERGDDRMWVFE